jgi:hypothetical protein
MPIILATQEAEMRRMVVQGLPKQTVHETPISKKKKKNHSKDCGSSNKVPALLITCFTSGKS